MKNNIAGGLILLCIGFYIGGYFESRSSLESIDQLAKIHHDNYWIDASWQIGIATALRKGEIREVIEVMDERIESNIEGFVENKANLTEHEISTLEKAQNYNTTYCSGRCFSSVKEYLPKGITKRSMSPSAGQL
ncbi:hypothetical protein [Oceanicoccus sp. KOV_DT_Chl]|uniref:hypothetical protein n=1 Tax=Oceanicoccus sp. KOV_DT_Chl TaxID=1904639 RepID=UPI000C7A30AB|nr:hypothetical protein [Oceanicoccus sp. KOV_DT_Chl]